MVLIGDRERDASSRENFPRACSLLLPASLQIDFVFKAPAGKITVVARLGGCLL